MVMLHTHFRLRCTQCYLASAAPEPIPDWGASPARSATVASRLAAAGPLGAAAAAGRAGTGERA